MEKIDQILNSYRKSPQYNDITVIKNKLNNDNNDTDKYSLKASGFVPRTENTQLAEEISKSMDDSKNYAFYLSVVNRLGVARSKQLLSTVLDDIRWKENTKTPVRNKGKYFSYIFKRNLF